MNRKHRAGASGGSNFARKYLDGWEAGVLAVFVAGAVAVVAVPRTVEPGAIPSPRLAPPAVVALRERWDGEAARAEAEELEPSVRLLGARIRVYGREERAGVSRRIASAHGEVMAAAAPALRERPDQVVSLAAHHGKLLAAALTAWIEDGAESDDLIELGGDAPAAFRANGWVTSAGAPTDFDLVVRALHRRRFVALVGSLDLETDRTETLLLNRFLIERSELSRLEDDDVKLGPTTMRRIDEIAAIDATYPATYARGIVLYRMGRFEAAASSFDAFLALGETGPYRLRAANYLKASVEAAAP